MKKYTYFLITISLIGIVALLAGFGGDEQDHSSGGDPGYTNSPGDGQNCTHCMGGSATAVTGWITSDIPSSGYVGGTTYTITVTATGTGKKGFEVSPQDITGNLIGTLTAGTGNKLVGLNKYVTHSSAVTTNPAVWTFQWTAPDPGVGEVTFYGSIAVTKTVTKTTTLTVSQSTVGIPEQTQTGFTVYPNPAHWQIYISFPLGISGRVSLELMSIEGKQIENLIEESLPAGIVSRTFTIRQPAGVYFFHLNTGERNELKKIIIQ